MYPRAAECFADEVGVRVPAVAVSPAECLDLEVVDRVAFRAAVPLHGLHEQARSGAGYGVIPIISPPTDLSGASPANAEVVERRK